MSIISLTEPNALQLYVRAANLTTSEINSAKLAAGSIVYNSQTEQLIVWDGSGPALPTSANFGNIQLSGNTVSATNTNGNINLTPQGTGDVIIPSGVSLRVGSTDLVNNRLIFDGATFGTIENQGNDVRIVNVGAVDITTGVGDITLTSADNIVLNCVNNMTINSSSGAVNVEGLSVADNVISSIGTNANIILNPNGSGDVRTDNLALYGNTIAALDANGNINLTPLGTGKVNVSTFLRVGSTDLINNQLAFSTGSSAAITNGAQAINFTASEVNYACVISPSTTNTRDIGSASFRWREIFSQLPLNVSSDANLKNTIVDLPLQFSANLIDDLKPKKYKLNGVERDDYGLLAQDVKASLAALGADVMTNGLYREYDNGEGGITCALAYTLLIAPMIKCIQDLRARVSVLEGN